MRELTVAVLVFDGVRLLDVTGPLEVLDVATVLGVPYRVVVCSADGRDVVTSSGLRLGVDAVASEVTAVDTVLVPGGEVLVDLPRTRASARHTQREGLRRLPRSRGLELVT